MKDVYDRKFKTLKKETEEDTRKLKDLPCSWIGRINIIKMAILPKTSYKFNEIPIKILKQFFTDLKEKYSTSYGKTKQKKKPKTG